MAKTKYAKVTVKKFKLSELRDAPYNARTITQQALKGLAASLEQNGLLALPVVNTKNKHPRLVAGHQRVTLLRKQGETHVHCIVVELDPATERQANFILNNEEIEGTFVPELTKALLDELKTAMPDSVEFKALRLDHLVKRVNKQLTLPPASNPRGRDIDEDAVPTTEAKSKAASKAGVFYRLGNHVILCASPKGRGTLKGFPVDTVSLGFTEVWGEEPTESYLETHLGRLIDHTEGAIYIATDTALLPKVQGTFVSLGGHWSTTLLWQNAKHEADEDQAYDDVLFPVVYGWSDGTKRVFFGSKSAGNVFSLKRACKSTRTPVEIAEKVMQLSSEKGAWVLDTAVGQGTTVIAAEKTGRRLIGYVRNSRACDSVRKRWAEFVHGKKTAWKAQTPEYDPDSED